MLRADLSPPSLPSAGSLYFLFLCEIIESRVRGGNQCFIRIIAEHQSERNHFNLRLSVGMPDEIYRADGICGFAIIAVPTFEQSNVSVPESLLQGVEVVFDCSRNRHHSLLIYR